MISKDVATNHATHDDAAIYALQGNARAALKWLKETADTGMPSYMTVLA